MNWKMVALSACFAAASMSHAQTAFRPPAVPLVTSDPYLSIWSEANKLTDDVTRHWTHHPHPLSCQIWIDGTDYRMMGNEPADVPPLPQIRLTVTPTRTLYTFANAQVAVTFTFMTPLLPAELSVFSRPVTYLTWDVRSLDGKTHTVRLRQAMSPLLAVESADEETVTGIERFGKLTAVTATAKNPTILRPAGDDTRINWGKAYLVAVGPANESADRPTGSEEGTMTGFDYDLGKVGSKPVERHMMIGY
ncbi:MAG TPA: DUF5127 domain-containing protein, partial [Fimbriimonadaceae bacterium]|nr:DUF5127 domain-containing protein [Fimbriimonadaceae bacterium]